jgi:hypothetical protein
MKKFLYIFEDGGLLISNKPDESDIQSSMDGYVTIINIEEGTVLNHKGIWEKITEDL